MEESRRCLHVGQKEVNSDEGRGSNFLFPHISFSESCTESLQAEWKQSQRCEACLKSVNATSVMV